MATPGQIIQDCPCGSGHRYTRCCGRYHQGEPAPSAEALMRSRYSAYVLGLLDYLRHSWHPDTCPGELMLEPGLRWLGLKIHHTEAGGPADNEGRVTFVARHKLHGRAGRLQENSRFVRHQGRWVYLDGEIRQQPIGLNS
ncbi:MAG: YchJ family protein [Thiohalomonadaceae bacterium]